MHFVLIGQLSYVKINSGKEDQIVNSDKNRSRWILPLQLSRIVALNSSVTLTLENEGLEFCYSGLCCPDPRDSGRVGTGNDASRHEHYGRACRDVSSWHAHASARASTRALDHASVHVHANGGSCSDVRWHANASLRAPAYA